MQRSGWGLTHRVVLVFAAVVLMIAGCSSDSGRGPGAGGGISQPDVPDRVVATILVANEELVLLDLRAATDDALPPPPAIDPVLDWQLEDAAGALIAEGRISEPLLVKSEFDESGVAAPIAAYAGAAIFEIELPNVGGTFVIGPPDVAGSQPQSWSGFKKKLKLAIEKLVGIFKQKAAGSGAGGSGGTSAGGGSSGGGGSVATGGAATGTGGGSTSGATVEADPSVQIAKPAGCTAFTILIVAEGYTKDEREKFEADAAAMLAAMSQKPTFSENWKYVGAWRKFFVSKESGISDPANGITRDTAFRVQHDAAMPRVILMADDVSQDALTKLAQAKGETKADVTLVVANTSQYAGVAIPSQRIGYASTHTQAGEVMGHELGHALFDLADEYSEGTCDPASSFVGANVTFDLKAVPWSALLTKGAALPTTGGDASTVGAYEGAVYCTSGAYRPQQTCFMRELGTNFCAVCAGIVNKFFTSRTAACQPKGSCGHGECQTGAALTKSCSACASAVCSTLPKCCDPAASWDDACVQAAQKLPGACRAVCADGQSSCAHDECAAGEALPLGCSSCADSVCKRDPFCCKNKWDWICAMNAKKDPFCVCP
jgi:hypothetical protein